MNKMNQTQTRSPRKRLLSLILAVILMIGLLPISAFATSASAQANDAEDTGYKYNIMFLDCGRKYFSVNSIKQIIDNASAAGFNYIQLAVGNDGLRFLLKDMSLEVGDKTYTSDAVTAAIETGNKQYSDSKGTTNSALSETDMDTIIAYAASKGMGVIPCVNTPGHMDAILSAATSLTGETCSYRGSARTIDVTNTTAVAFTQALLQKYISYFAGKGCKLFNMGADEYANDKFTGGSMGFGNLQDTGNYRYYVDYVNAVAKMIKTAGMKPMAFNDGIYFNSNTSSGTFDTDILICYWSNGWSSYAPMPAANLAAKGFKLINTNGDYYWVLGGTQCSADKAKEFDYKSFPAKQGDNGTIDNPSGSMFCIWCDYPDAETEDSVISKTAATIAAFGKALPSLKFCVKDSGGDTSVTIGGVKYNIHVTAEDLTKVTPLPLEYWITNAAISSVTDCETTTRTNKKSESYTVYYTPVAADRGGVASAGGVDVTTIAPADTERDGRTIYYWRCRMLDKTLTNTSTSGTQQQTNDGGDDETTSGIGFTKIRYYGGSWQVFTENNEWVTVDTTKIQLVAYYLENIKVSDEVESYAADWGNRGDNTEGGWLDANSYCTLSMQVVYEDATTNPTTTTANDLKAKTIVYGYWSANGGRGIGTVMLDGQEYEIYKVTSETGEATATISSGTNGNYKANVTNLTWDGNEMTVWEGEPSSSVTIHNDSNGFKTDGANANLCWDENKEAILIRVYVRAKATPDSLTVNYYDQADPKAPFYSYNIAVKQGTQFDDSFVYVPSTEQGKSGSLKGNTVTNINNLPQTVEWALEKMTQIKAQYRYSDYIFVNANRESDGKTVNLYYTFTREKTFVVDFGLPLVIRPADVNDRLSGNGVNLTGIEVANKTSFASITTDASKNITYSLNKMIDQMDTFSVQYTGHIKNDQGNLQSGTVKYTLTIIPASNVYYEDSLATFTNGKGVAKDAKWSIDDQATADQKSATQALEQLGSSGIYGKDAAYNSSSMLSMGTAHKVTVTADMLAKWDDTTSAWPTAQFTFKGTGFDIISLTDNTSGVIQVKVYKANSTDTTPVKNILVNNYYGYTRDGAGNWVVSNSEDPNALYQIPVVKVDGLDYGTYNVTIEVFYSKYFDKTTKSQYSFWLDAIRVYNPMGEGYDYTADNEGYPQYIKLHDKLADTAATSGDEQVLFIDGAEHATIAQYANYGPKNEVYLAKGQAISFKLTGNTNEIARIQIGAKAPDGQPTMTVKGNGSTTSAKNEVLSTATEMYYDITEQAKNGQLVTISNTSRSILSLTNLKITYKTSGQTVTLSDLTATEQANAVAVVQALFAAPVATFSPETFQADWGRAVRAGKRATLTVKTSADVESITVDGQAITSYTTRTQRTGWGWWSPKVTYHVFTYTITAPAQTTDYAVCAVNAEGTASEAVTATLTVRPATWWNWWF